MDDALLVRRFKSFGALRGNREGLIHRDRALGDPVGESRPLNQLQDQRAGVALLLQPVDMPDIGVVQRREHLRLALKARQPIRVRCERFWQDLEGHVPVERGVTGLVDLAMPPSPILAETS